MLRSNISTGIDIKSLLPDTSISSRGSPWGCRIASGASCPPKSSSVRIQNTPLDSLTISGTNHTQKDVSVAFKKAVKTRFSGNHWHTRQFREWAEHAENTVICHTCVEAPNENGDQDIGIYALPTNYAFASYAGKRNQGLVYSFAEAITGLPGLAGAPLVHFVTLTVPHGLTGSYGDMKQTVEALRAGWSGIRRYLNRWGCRYLRVIEPGGKRGYPHYHLIVLGLTSARAEQLLERWVSIVPGAVRQAQNVQEVQDINNLGAYLTKTLGYVAKQWDDKRSPCTGGIIRSSGIGSGYGILLWTNKAGHILPGNTKIRCPGWHAVERRGYNGETHKRTSQNLQHRGGDAAGSRACRPPARLLHRCILLYGQPRKQTHFKNTKIQNVNSYTQKTYTKQLFFKKKLRSTLFRGQCCTFPSFFQEISSGGFIIFPCKHISN